MPYTYSRPTSVAFTGKGLFGYSFGPLHQNLNIYYIQSEKGHDTFMISRKITRTYYVLSGGGYFTIEGKRYPVDSGIVVEVPPKVEYSYSGKMALLGISIPGWFSGNDTFTKLNPDVFGYDAPCVVDKAPWWKRLVRTQIFGKSPLGLYRRLNEWLWKKHPARFSALVRQARFGRPQL